MAEPTRFISNYGKKRKFSARKCRQNKRFVFPLINVIDEPEIMVTTFQSAFIVADPDSYQVESS